MKNQVSSPLYKKIRPDIAVSESGQEKYFNTFILTERNENVKSFKET